MYRTLSSIRSFFIAELMHVRSYVDRDNGIIVDSFTDKESLDWKINDLSCCCSNRYRWEKALTWLTLYSSLCQDLEKVCFWILKSQITRPWLNLLWKQSNLKTIIPTYHCGIRLFIVLDLIFLYSNFCLGRPFGFRPREIIPTMEKE